MFKCSYWVNFHVVQSPGMNRRSRCQIERLINLDKECRRLLLGIEWLHCIMKESLLDDIWMSIMSISESTRKQVYYTLLSCALMKWSTVVCEVSPLFLYCSKLLFFFHLNSVNILRVIHFPIILQYLGRKDGWEVREGVGGERGKEKAEEAGYCTYQTAHIHSITWQPKWA